MSEPRVMTDRECRAVCPRCGAVVVYRESVGLYGSPARFDMREKHAAPCGLPCFGGGARGPDGLVAFRDGRMHGLEGYPAGVWPADGVHPEVPYPGAPARPCPACTGLPPVALVRRERAP